MLIIARGSGRLGNRLQTFAHTIAAGIEYGVYAWNPAFGEYSRFFPAIAADPLGRFPVKSFGVTTRLARRHLARLVTGGRTPVGAEAIHKYLADRSPVTTVITGHYVDCNMSSQRFRKLVETKRAVLLYGYRFYHPAIDTHRETIRKFLRPDPNILKRSLESVNAARGTTDVLVGVHIRRGDYREWRYGRYYYSYAQYASLMKQVQSIFGAARTSFLICSDDAAPLAPFEGLQASIGYGQVLEDLYSLAHCDWLIGPPSSFTTWASYYGDAPVYQVEDPDAPVSIDRFRPMNDLPYINIREKGFYQGERWD